MKDNYYKKELDRLKSPGYLTTVSLLDSEGNRTKNLCLNNECIQELMDYLEKLMVNNK